MATRLRVLVVENRQKDYELILRQLRRAGYEPDARQVDTERDFLAALDSPFDIIISEYSLPNLAGLSALKLVKDRKLEIPFIFFSKAIGQPATTNVIKRGAFDYVSKERPARLERAVARALTDTRPLAKAPAPNLRSSGAADRTAKILDHAAEAIIALDSHQHILFYNQAAETMFGYKASEMIGKPLDPILPRDLAQVHRDHVRAFVESADSERQIKSRQSLLARRKDGSQFPVEIGISKIDDGSERINVAMIVDITERQRVENALKESEERYRSLFATSLEGIGLSNGNQIVDANQALLNLFGYPDKAEFLDIPLLAHVAPKSRGIVEERIRKIANGEPVEPKYSFWIVRKNREERELEISTAQVRIGTEIYTQGTFRDKTEQKRAEEAQRQSESRYRTLFENMLEGFAHCEMIFEDGEPIDFNYLTVNGAFEKLTGLKDVVGKKASEVIPGIRHSNPELFEICGRVASTGVPEKFESFVEPLASWFSVSVYSYQRGFFIAVFDTITDRKRAEREIIRRNQQLLSLHQVGQDLIHLAHPPEILESIFQAIGQVLDNRNLYIALYDEEKQYLDFPIYTINGERRNARGRALGNGITEYVVRQRAPLFVPTRLDEKMTELGIDPIGTPAKTFMAVPMRVGHKVIGVIALQNYERDHAYDQTDLELLSTFAAQAANALENATLFEETHKRADQFRSLYETVRELATFTDLPGLLKAIVDRATGMLGSPSGIMYLFDPLREELELVAVRASQLKPGMRYSIRDPGGMVAQAARTRQPVIVNDYPTWKDRRPETVELGIRAAIQVPMLYRGALIGILGVGEFGDTRRTFTEGDAQLLTLFAGHAAAAVHNTRLLEETKKSADEFAALYETALDLSGQTETRQLLETIVERARTLLKSSAGAVYLYDAARHDLELAVSLGAPQLVGTHLKLGEGAAGRVAQSREPIIVDDYQTWEERSPQYEGVHFAAVLDVPMLYGGAMIGVLVVHELGKSNRKFTDADSRLLMLLASQAASAVNNARLLEETTRRAEEFSDLYETTRDVTAQYDLHGLLHTLTERAAHLLHATDGDMQLYDDLRGDLEVIVNLNNHVAMGTRTRLGEGLAGRVAQSGTPLVVDDYETWDGREKKYEGLHAHGAVDVPMRHAGRLIGVLSVYECGESRRKFNEDDVRLLSLFASHAASAVHNARLLKETRARAEQLSTLNEVGRTISSNVDIENVIEALQSQAARIIPFDTFYVALYDSTTGRLTYPLYYEGGKRYSEPSTVIKRETYLGRTIDTATPLLINRTEQELGSSTAPANPLGDTSKKSSSLMYVPLVYGARAIGLISVQSYTLNAYNDEHLSMLGAIANQAAVAIENARLFEQTKKRAEQLSTLNEIGRAVSSRLDVDQTLQEIHQQVKRIIPLDAFYVALYDQDKNEISYPLFYDEGKRYNEASGVPAEGTRLAETIRTGKSILFNHTPESLAAEPRTTMLGNKSRPSASTLFAPLRSGPLVIGAISAQSYTLSAYSEEHLDLFNGIANQAAIAIENARLFADTQRHLQQVQSLHEIDNAISGSLDLRVTFNVFLDQIVSQLGADAGDILLLNQQTQTLEFAAARGFHTPALQHTHLRVGEGLAGRAALDRKVVTVPDLVADPASLSRSPFLQNERFASYYGVPLIAKGRVNGVLEIFQRSQVERTTEWLDFLETLAGQAAIAIDNAELYENLQRANISLSLAYDTTLEGWSRALDLRDRETEGHTERVSEMTLRLAREMAIHEAELVHIHRGALLHDIGKMGIPDAILFKPGPLTEDEWTIMRLHPVFAHELISPIEFLRPALDIPYCHHEKWDGSGYPRGLKGEQIPLAARLFAVADVWDALSSDRPYRNAWDQSQVRQYLREQSGSHFDSKVVEVFLRTLT
jgi:PAS domain S-box-containing protein